MFGIAISVRDFTVNMLKDLYLRNDKFVQVSKPVVLIPVGYDSLLIQVFLK